MLIWSRVLYLLSTHTHVVFWYQPVTTEFVGVPLSPAITGGSDVLEDISLCMGWSEARALLKGPGCLGGSKCVDLLQSNDIWLPHFPRWVPIVCDSLRLVEQPMSIADIEGGTSTTTLPLALPSSASSSVVPYLPTAAEPEPQPRMCIADRPVKIRRMQPMAFDNTTPSPTITLPGCFV